MPVKPTMAEVLAHDLKALLSGVARCVSSVIRFVSVRPRPTPLSKPTTYICLHSAAIARLTDAVAAEASTVSSSSASNANSPIIPEGQQQPQQQSGAAGPVPVPAERLLMQLPSALAARYVSCLCACSGVCSISTHLFPPPHRIALPPNVTNNTTATS